jgi:GT2 family glycosyltransferase
VTTVAALVPTYNSAATVAETLRSLLRQAAPLDRLRAVFVADDRSVDETVGVATRTWPAGAGAPLRVLPARRNLGPYGNANRAIESLAGEVDWVLLLHGDDLAREDWLGTMLDRVTGCDARTGSICSSWDTLRPDGTVMRGEEAPGRTVELVEGTLASVRGTLLRGCWWHVSGCAIRASAFADVGSFDPALPYHGDWDWLIRSLARRWSVEYVPRTLVLYRQHAASVSARAHAADRDVEESLRIVRRYRRALTTRDLVRFHAVRAGHILRRIARASVRGDLVRCARSFRTLGAVASSASRCVLGAARPGLDAGWIAG